MHARTHTLTHTCELTHTHTCTHPHTNLNTHTVTHTHTKTHTHLYTQTHNIPKAGKRLIKAVPVRRVACQRVRGAQFPGPPRVSRRGGRVEWWTWRCPACRRRCCPTPGRRTWHHWRWPGSPGSWCQTSPAAHCLWTRRWGWGDGGGGGQLSWTAVRQVSWFRFRQDSTMKEMRKREKT